MDVVFDMATIAVIGFAVVLALGAMFRKDPRLRPQPLLGFVGLLLVVSVLQLVPAPVTAIGGDPAADGSAVPATGAVPTTPATRRPSAGAEAVTTSPRPADRPLTVADFLASGDQPTQASRRVRTGDAAPPGSLTVYEVCGPRTVWTFALAGKYGTVEMKVQLTGKADPVPAVTIQATADDQSISTALLTNVGESKRLRLDVAQAHELVLTTSATGAAECPNLFAQWTDFRVTSR